MTEFSWNPSFERVQPTKRQRCQSGCFSREKSKKDKFYCEGAYPLVRNWTKNAVLAIVFSQHQLDKERTSLPQGRFLLRWLNLAESLHLRERNPQKGNVAKAVAFHEKKARKTSFIARAHTWKVCNWTKNAVFCRFLPWKIIDLTSLSFYIIQGIAEKRKGLKPISKR